MVEDGRVFGVTRDWSTAALNPGVRYSAVCESGYQVCVYGSVGKGRGKFVRNPAERKREADEADKVKVATWCDRSKLETFRAMLIGPNQRLPKRRLLCR